MAVGLFDQPLPTGRVLDGTLLQVTMAWEDVKKHEAGEHDQTKAGGKV